MKKTVSLLTALLLCLWLILPMAVSAASATASLTGPGTVRAGDTITLTFKLNGSGLYGVSGTLSYDANQLTLTGTKQKIASPWMVEFNGNNMVAYDNNLSAPISDSKDLFTVSFQVKNVAAGTAITVSYTNVIASDGSADANIGTVSYRVTVAEPLSANNALGSLTVNNATISPAFNANTTSYTVEVPFSVSKLNVQATAADSKAKVSISSPNLTPDGYTNVTITVTAENGSQKIYIIKVHREKDPNYVASGNNDLSEITVEGFLLSPVFSSDVTEYVVWLPYETESVKVSGKASDGKASVQVVGGDDLLAGQDNPVKVICTAENGEVKEYTVIVKRAAAHDGSVDIPPEETEATDPTEETEVTEPTEGTEATDPVEETEATDSVEPEPTDAEGTELSDAPGGIPWWLLLIVGFVCLGVGFACGSIVEKRRKI